MHFEMQSTFEYLCNIKLHNMKTEDAKKFKTQTLISLLVIGIGILLMVFKIYADSEPGAIPLFMILAGAVWYFIIRIQLRSQSKIR
jgi:hypothetical protein